MKKSMVIFGLMMLFVSFSAFAEGSDPATIDASKWYAIACGLCIAIAAFGGAIGQGRAVAAALEGIARNPGASGKIFIPMIVGLALIESLVIYALVISLILSGKF